MIQMPRCNPESFSQTRTGRALQLAQVQAITYVQEGDTIEGTDTRQLRIDSVRVDGQAAIVEICEVDHSVVYAPDGSVVDDRPYSGVLRWTFVFENDRWLISEPEVLARSYSAENPACEV